MTFQDFETSVHDGAPIELYLFTGPNATYAYTSCPVEITRDFITYAPLPMKRTRIKSDTSKGLVALTLTLPLSCALSQDYAFGISPRDLDVVIYRRHGISGPESQIWSGKVTTANPNLKENTIEFSCPSVTSLYLSTPCPNLYYQAPCNHALYSTRCGVSRGTYQFTTTIATGGANVTDLVLTSVNGNPDNHYKAGEIVRQADGERRLIVSQTGLSVVLNFPFRALDEGDTVDIYAGCNHIISGPGNHCKDKFNNVINALGFEFIPKDNVFEKGLK